MSTNDLSEIENLQRESAAHPERYELLEALGHAAIAHGLNDLAARAFTQFVALAPSPSILACRNGVVLSFENNDFEASRRTAEKALEVHSNDPVCQAYLAGATCIFNPSRENIQAFRRVFKANPEQWGSLYSAFAHTLDQAGRAKLAVDDLTQMIEFLQTKAPDSAATASALYEKVHLLAKLADDEALAQGLEQAKEYSFELFQSLRYLKRDSIPGSEPTLISEQLDDLVFVASLELVDYLNKKLIAITARDMSFPHRNAESPVRMADVQMLCKNYKFISSERLHEYRSELSNLGVCASFLDAVAGSETYQARVSPPLSGKAWRDDKRVSPRVRGVLDILDSGYKSAISPFDGAVLRSNVMLAPETFCFGNTEDAFAVSQWAEADRCLDDTIWIMPKIQTVIFFTESFLSEDVIRTRINEMFLNLLSGYAESLPGHTGDRRPVFVAPAFLPHIGHHIWNGISGWSMLFRYARNMAMPNGVVCYAGQDMIGDVKDFYSDIDLPAATVLKNEAGIYELLSNNMVLTIKDNFITEDLAARVKQACYRRSSLHLLKKASALRSSCFPMVLVTIRLGNRSWIGQQDGLAQILTALRADFPNAGFVIDGINSDVTQGWTHALMSVQEEMRTAEAIISKCDKDIIVLNSINCSAAESIALGEMCDAFIAPVGAGMAKYRWIANLPGVAYSNESFSADDSFAGHLYDNFREHARHAVHVPLRYIKDVEAEVADPSRRNFEMNWRELYRISRDHFKNLFASG